MISDEELNTLAAKAYESMNPAMDVKVLYKLGYCAGASQTQEWLSEEEIAEAFWLTMQSQTGDTQAKWEDCYGWQRDEMLCGASGVLALLRARIGKKPTP